MTAVAGSVTSSSPGTSEKHPEAPAQCGCLNQKLSVLGLEPLLESGRGPQLSAAPQVEQKRDGGPARPSRPSSPSSFLS